MVDKDYREGSEELAAQDAVKAVEAVQPEQAPADAAETNEEIHFGGVTIDPSVAEAPILLTKVPEVKEDKKAKSERSLTSSKKSTGGRNNHGHTTVRFRGGGVKQRYRLIDFKRDKDDIPARVKQIEYDPNRSADIALLFYADGEKRYILAPAGLAAGDTVVSGNNVDIVRGNALPLRSIPVGTIVHNIELKPGKGGQLARSAGASVRVMGKEGNYALLLMPSGELRMVLLECKATVGAVGNADHVLEKLGKAGKSRHLGRRPHVRGSAMNPVDHPHGGGEGKAPVGHSEPRTPWGKKSRGVKTRKRKLQSDRLIVRRRKTK